MSFGWSAGDTVSTAKLPYHVGSAMKESGGASSKYVLTPMTVTEIPLLTLLRFQDTISFLQTLTHTLEYLNILQTTDLVPTLATTLEEQFQHIRVPLQTFFNDVGKKFSPSLSRGSRRNKFLAAPRKVHWAISTSKKVKHLQERIAVSMAAVSMILGQQIVYVHSKPAPYSGSGNVC
jgi:hypothetical protein